MSAAETLGAAADHIERHGWTQRSYLRQTAASPLPAHRAPVCARGAIAAAAGRHPLFGLHPVQFATAPLAADELAADDRAALDAVQAAERALAGHLRRTIPGLDSPMSTGDAITRWNDRIAGGVGEVLAALRAAAGAER